MSYDISVWSLPRVFSREDAIDVWNDICTGKNTFEELQNSNKLEAFQSELELKHPQIDSLPDNKIDQSPWSCAFDREGPTLTLSCAWSRAKEISHLVYDLAMKHQLAVFDFHTELIYMPASLVTLTDCTLHSPHLLKPIAGYSGIIPDIIDVVTGKDDPFLIIERSGQVYMQTLWTEEGFLLEYRNGSEDEHYRASSFLNQDEITEVLQDYLIDAVWKDKCIFERVSL